MNKTIQSGPDYEAFVVHRASDTVVVSFAERKEPAPADFLGETMLLGTEYAYCCIRSLTNDWYLGPGFPACLAAVAEELGAYRRIVLYGFSMGSYGALISAGTLRADRLVLMAPIVNVHPDRERRWIGDYGALIRDRTQESLNPQVPEETEVICVYDPKGEDCSHVADLKRAHPVREIITPRAGHMVLQFLVNGGILGQTARALLLPVVDIARVQSEVISSRKNNSYYVGELARSLSRHETLKKRLLRYALCRFPDDLTIRLDYAGLLAGEGEHAEAAELIRAVVAESPDEAVGVPVARALVRYAESGGSYESVADLAATFASDAPRPREAQLLYSRFLRHTRRFDDAFRAHESFMKGGPFSAQGFFERGLIFELLDLPYMARTSYRQALVEEKNFHRAAQRLKQIETRRKE
jgi:uncharacterized protein (TIGR02996 family)